MTSWYMKLQNQISKILFVTKGWLVQDEDECLYIYAQTMNGKRQYGLVGCAGVEDYMNDIIKKHELTRKDKEADRNRACKGNKCQHGACILYIQGSS
jgi:uncharacterized protein (DUF1015 family)